MKKAIIKYLILYKFSVIKDNENKIAFISLTDICKYLKVPHLMDNVEEWKFCDTKVRLQLDGDHSPEWYIKLYQVKEIIRKTQKPQKYNSFLAWINNLPATAYTPPNFKKQFDVNAKTDLKQNKPKKTTAANEKSQPYIYKMESFKMLRINAYRFELNRHAITFKIIFDTLYINATDLGKIINKSPTLWINRSDIRQLLINNINGCLPHELADKQIIIVHGKEGGTWMEARIAEKYAYSISDEIGRGLKKLIREFSSKNNLKIIPLPVDKNPNKDVMYYLLYNEVKPELTSLENKIKENSKILEISQNPHAVLIGLIEWSFKNSERLKNSEDYLKIIDNKEYYTTKYISDELGFEDPYQMNLWLKSKNIVQEITKEGVKTFPVIPENKTWQITIPGTNKLRWTVEGKNGIVQLFQNEH